MCALCVVPKSNATSSPEDCFQQRALMTASAGAPLSELVLVFLWFGPIILVTGRPSLSCFSVRQRLSR